MSIRMLKDLILLVYYLVSLTICLSCVMLVMVSGGFTAAVLFAINMVFLTVTLVSIEINLHGTIPHFAVVILLWLAIMIISGQINQILIGHLAAIVFMYATCVYTRKTQTVNVPNLH
jgi:hypothetical protein